MAYFVLDKDVTSGSLRLPIDGAFGTREDALSALSAAVAAGEATVGGQVFVVDLDAALPVLVMPTPVAAPAMPLDAPVEPLATPEEEIPAADDTPLEVEPEVEEPEAVAPEVEEAEVDELEVVEPEVVEPEAASTPGAVVVGALAGGSLADALKRAANSLEDEGIIAPDSIDAGDFSFEDELVEETAAAEAAEAPDESAIGEAPASVGVAEPMSAASEEPAEVLEAPVDWPWANVEAFDEDSAPESDVVEVEAEAAEAEPAPAQTDEPDTLITSAPPMGEEAYVPRPVILGDYADFASDGVAETPAVVEPEPAQDEVTPDEESAFSAPAEGVIDLEPAAPAEMAYEPTGELDLSTYTCNDCVYSNTCPKVGEVTPADCGTFQWRSS